MDQYLIKREKNINISAEKSKRAKSKDKSQTREASYEIDSTNIKN